MLAADGKNLPFLVQDFGSQPGVIQMQALLINMDKAGHLKPRHFAYAAKFPSRRRLCRLLVQDNTRRHNKTHWQSQPGPTFPPLFLLPWQEMAMVLLIGPKMQNNRDKV